MNSSLSLFKELISAKMDLATLQTELSALAMDKRRLERDLQAATTSSSSSAKAPQGGRSSWNVFK
jgi:hypothetical protein